MPKTKKKTKEIDYQTNATPKAVTEDGIPVFCSHDQLVGVEKVIPNPKNPNTHGKDQVELLARIIGATGWRQPITVSKRSGFIVKGHGRLQAAISAGWKQVPVDYQEYANDAEEWADLIADNRLAELSQMDNGLLIDLLKEYDQSEAPLELTGYSDESLNDLLDEWQDPVERDVAEVEPEVNKDRAPMTKQGDLWTFGDHRLLCGDSTSETDVKRLMAGDTADICFTSPPYNAGSLNVKGQPATFEKYGTYQDTKTDDEYLDFLQKNLSLMLKAAKEVFYNIGLVEGNKRSIIRLQNKFINQFKDIIYWEKNTCAPHIQPGVINNLVEFILCFGDGHRKFENAQFSQGTYWNVIKGSGASGNEYSDIHKATFPLYLPENIITNFCPTAGTVIDCFGGTGTTMRACEIHGRKSYTMEIDPIYCDVIVNSYVKLTGNTKATCERDGKIYTYTELKKENDLANNAGGGC